MTEPIKLPPIDSREGFSDYVEMNMRDYAISAVRQAVAAEREWLAGALEDQCRKMSDHFETKWLFEIIKAIRARSS